MKPKVKQLEWNVSESFCPFWYATFPYLSLVYNVNENPKYKNKYELTFWTGRESYIQIACYKTIEAAKNGAQRHFERHILQCLED